MAQIFLCHASEDKPQVREIYQRLQTLGFSLWLDEEEILPGQDWDYEIEQALETADFVLVFLSKRSVEKIGYVQREFRRAMYRSEEMPEGYIHTIPVKLDDCTVPRRFSRHQWAKLYEEGAFDRIVRALHHGLLQRGWPMGGNGNNDGDENTEGGDDDELNAVRTQLTALEAMLPSDVYAIVLMDVQAIIRHYSK
jgi:hypothetical protein